MASVLEQEYIEPTRPYSQNELKHKRETLHKKLRLGTTRALHNRCRHFYLTKRNSRKENDIKEAGHGDVGNCSVCWKYRKTRRRLQRTADELITAYEDNFFDEPQQLTYSLLDIETAYYTWLYDENPQ